MERDKLKRTLSLSVPTVVVSTFKRTVTCEEEEEEGREVGSREGREGRGGRREREREEGEGEGGREDGETVNHDKPA